MQYQMEHRATKVGFFLLCSVRNAGLKKYYIMVSKGKGLVGDRVSLAKKLRRFGVKSFAKVVILDGRVLPKSIEVVVGSSNFSL